MIIIFNVLILLVAIIILFYLLEKDLGLIILSLVVFIQYIWMFLSLPVIESGIFINEQGRNGYFVFSGFVLLLFFLSTVFSLLFFRKVFTYVFQNFKTINIIQKPIKDHQLALILFITILFLAYLNLLSSPIPIVSDKVSKFNFWEYAKYPKFRSFFGNIIAFFGFGSILIYRRNKILGLALLIIYMVYLILMDQKFTGFLICFYGIFAALYYTSKKRPVFKLKWILNRYVFVGSGILFGLILYKYSVKNPFGYLGLTPFESIFYRTFGLQAHLFWGTCEQYVYLNKANTWDLTELSHGMHVLMLEFWPWSHENYVLLTSRGVSWTNGYPSILLRIFPLPLALIINFLFISIFALFQVLLKNFIERGSFILSIVLFQILVWVNYTFTMGYFNKLGAPILILIIYLIYNYFRYKQFEGISANS